MHDERARSVHGDPALAAIVAAWPTLPAHVRAQLLAVIQGPEQRSGEVR